MMTDSPELTYLCLLTRQCAPRRIDRFVQPPWSYLTSLTFKFIREPITRMENFLSALILGLVMTKDLLRSKKKRGQVGCVCYCSPQVKSRLTVYTFKRTDDQRRKLPPTSFLHLVMTEKGPQNGWKTRGQLGCDLY